MRYFLSLHIHSGFSGYSSNDKMLHKEVTKKEFDETEDCGEDEAVIKNAQLDFIVKHVPSDKTFYNLALKNKTFSSGYENTEEFKNLVNFYLANRWKEEGNSDFKTLLDKHFKLKAKKLEEKRLEEDYLFPSYEFQKKVPAEYYQGGFSDLVFNQEFLQNYVKGGVCFGYIGHFVRKKHLDRFLEICFFKVKEHKDNAKFLAVWLTSTDGRHFGDALELKSFTDQCEHIRKNISTIWNNAFIYSKDEHGGTLSSTIKLKNKYKKELVKD